MTTTEQALLKLDTAPVLSEEIASEWAEEAVVGSLLIDPAAIGEIKGLVYPQDFYYVRCRTIFESILALHEKGQEVDNITVTVDLQERGELVKLGGTWIVTELINHTPTSSHVESYAHIVAVAAQRRRLMGFASQIANLVITPGQTLDELNRTISAAYQQVTGQLRSRSIVSGKQLLDEMWQDYIDYTGDPQSVRGLRTGIPDLDTKLGGIRPGLYALGGAASMGKSTLAGGLLYHLATQVKCLYVPTEIAGRRALQKVATDLAGIAYKTFISGFLNPVQHEAYTTAFNKLNNVRDNLTVVDGVRPDIGEIEAEISRANIGCLIVDSGTAMSYQNMNKGKQSDDLRLRTTALCQRLQDIGRHIPVLVTWQTGRNAKGREHMEPRINDFRESGAIEETADVAIGIYRHSYYVSRGMADPDPATYPPHTCAILVLKDRDGGNGDGRITVGFKAGQGFTQDDES